MTETKEKDKLDVLAEGKSTVKRVELKIADRTFKVGKLSAIQSIRLITFFGNLMLHKSSAKMVKRFQEQGKDTSNLQDLLILTEEMQEAQMLVFIGILLDTKDVDFINNEVGAEELSDILRIFCEYNDLSKILKNVFRTMEKMSDAMQKAFPDIKQQKKEDGKQSEV